MSVQDTVKMVDFHEKLSVERLKSLQDLLKLLLDLNKDKQQSFDATDSPAVKLLDEHLKKGGELKCQEIDIDNAMRFEQLLKFYHVPFYAIEATTAKTGEDKAIFITRDSDSESITKVINHLDFELRTRLGWIGIEDFIRYNEGEKAYMVNMSEEDLSRFADEVFNKDIRFTVEFLSDGGCDIYFMPDCKESIEKCLEAMENESGNDSEVLKIEECVFDKDLIDKILLQEAENHIHEKYESNDITDETTLAH